VTRSVCGDQSPANVGAEVTERLPVPTAAIRERARVATWHVTVLRNDTRAPLPGTTVEFVRDLDAVAKLARPRVALTTDPSGRVQVPFSSTGGWFTVLGEWFARAWLDSQSAASVDVVAERDGPLSMQALGGDGRPIAGITFGVLLAAGSRRFPLGNAPQPTADPTVRAIPFWRSRLHAGLSAHPECYALVIECAGPLLPATECWNGAIPAHPERLRVLLPAAGSVVLNVIARDPADTTRRQVSLAVAEHGNRYHPASQWVVAGRAVFENVGLGQNLCAWVDRSAGTDVVSFTGPRFAGEVVNVELQ
jgi:hypothetical protein